MVKRLTRSSREKKDIIKAKGGKCVYCGCTHMFLLNLDHKVPLVNGGVDDVKNIQATCLTCNNLKADMGDGEFKKYIKILNQLWDYNKIKVDTCSPYIQLQPYSNINPVLPKFLNKGGDVKNG